jgi:phage host-nuclease inhibitor protein Gam
MATKKNMADVDRSEMDVVIRELCIATIELDRLTAQMNEEIASVKARYQSELETFSSIRDNLFARAEEWAKSHRGEFASKRSIAFLFGTIGFRSGNPTLKTLRGVTWERVVDTLRQLLPAYVREKPEVDKAGILAAVAAGEIGAENLTTLGLRVDQPERFYVDPNKDVVEKELVAKV